eukprot:c2716_g1_i2.p1 GENE.c2716_g1_i2~~c2716_g1_i2.p1  ORF type:complete len:249 (+),score=38.74 c2716_g1_i2:174-920(+)
MTSTQVKSFKMSFLLQITCSKATQTMWVSVILNSVFAIFVVSNLFHCLRFLYSLCFSADVLWRTARATHQYSKTVSDDDIKKSLVFKSFSLANQSLISAPNRWETNKWCAITVGNTAQFEGNNRKIEIAYLVYNDTTKAIAIYPSDWELHQLLGEWHYGISDVDAISRQLSAVLYQSLPPASFDQASTSFQKAFDLFPNPRTCVSLGDTQTKLDKKTDAKTWYQKALQLPAVSQEDRDAQVKAREKLN